MAAVGVGQRRAVDRGVDLRRGDVGMAEHLLDRAQVRAAFQQVRREGVAQQVRLHRHRDAGAAGGLLHPEPESLPGDRHPARAEEERAARPGPGQLRPARPEVGLQRGERGLADRDDAVLGALARHADEPRLRVEGLDLQRTELGDAEARAVHQLEHRAVAEALRGRRIGSRDDQGGLGGADHPGQLAPQLGPAGQLGEIIPAEADADEVGREGADRGEPSRQRSRRVALPVEHPRPRVDVRQADLGPVRPPRAGAVGREPRQVGLIGLDGELRRAALQGQMGQVGVDRLPEFGRRRLAAGSGRLGHASSVLPRPAGSP